MKIYPASDQIDGKERLRGKYQLSIGYRVIPLEQFVIRTG